MSTSRTPKHPASAQLPKRASSSRIGTSTGAPSSHEEVWAIIPARWASQRFPGKPLALLAGRPMIQHVYESTAQVPNIDRVWVATDDERIAAAVREFGGHAVRTGTHATGSDRIAEAASRLVETHGEPGWVLNVQSDEPLVAPGDLETLIEGMRKLPDPLLGTLVLPIYAMDRLLDPHVVKAVLTPEGQALYFSRAAIPHPRGNLPARTRRLGWHHLGIYLFRYAFLHVFRSLPPTPLSLREQLEQLRALEHGYAIHCFRAHSPSVGVDTPEDLRRAESLLAKRPPRGG